MEGREPAAGVAIVVRQMRRRRGAVETDRVVVDGRCEAGAVRGVVGEAEEGAEGLEADGGGGGEACLVSAGGDGVDGAELGRRVKAVGDCPVACDEQLLGVAVEPVG